MTHIAYSPYFHKIYKFPPLFQQNLQISPIFVKLTFLLIFWLNLRFLLLPILTMHLCIILYMYWMPLSSINYKLSFKRVISMAMDINGCYYQPIKDRDLIKSKKSASSYRSSLTSSACQKWHEFRQSPCIDRQKYVGQVVEPVARCQRPEMSNDNFCHRR